MERLIRTINASRVLKVLAYFVAWTVPALLSVTQLGMSYSMGGNEPSFLMLVRVTFPTWYAWAILAPLIYKAARRFPLDGAGWARSLTIHLAFNAVLTVVSVALIYGVRAALGRPRFDGLSVEVIGSMNTAIVAYWMIVLIAHAVRYYEDGRARAMREVELSARLTEARLETLRAQLQPHFLFNTMHAISAFVRENPDAAETLLAQLSDLLRLTLDRGDVSGLPLAEEIEFVERYLAIQRTRLGDRLSVTLDLPDALGSAEVPTMILQPLVENAVEHGVTRRRGPGSVRVGARRDGDRLVLEVEDDGPGLDDAALDPTTWRVGLRNTRERLRQLYGEAHSFTLQNGETGGVRVEIVIPFRTVEERAR